MIHKGFDFSQMGGFPLNQQRLEYMQSAYAGLSDAMVGMIGDNAIVSGCVVNGNRVSDGWVVISGELLPFVGGTQIATVVVKEIKTNLMFKNGDNKAVQFSKYATFGVGAEAVNWTDLMRCKLIKDLSKLPTETTDDPTVSDSNILATSKAVSDIYWRPGSIVGRKTKLIYKDDYEIPLVIDVPFVKGHPQDYFFDVNFFEWKDDPNDTWREIINHNDWISSVKVVASLDNQLIRFTVTLKNKGHITEMTRYYNLICSIKMV